MSLAWCEVSQRGNLGVRTLALGRVDTRPGFSLAVWSRATGSLPAFAEGLIWERKQIAPSPRLLVRTREVVQCRG